MIYKEEYIIFEIESVAKKTLDLLGKRKLILLHGDFGVGKTALAKQIIKILLGNANIQVTSPTFSIVNIYGNSNLQIAHFDCYRIKNPNELYEIGIEEFLKNYICLIEWPEIIEEKFLSDKDSIKIYLIETDKEDTRKIQIIY